MRVNLPYIVTHQNCASLLNHLGYSCPVEGYINAPYRNDTDKKFHVSNSIWYDYVLGEGGHVVNLALKMVGNEKCYQVLCEAIGYDYESVQDSISQYVTSQKEVTAIYAKIQKAFPVSTAPGKVKEYLAGRRVTAKTESFLSYIPDYKSLDGILTVEEKILSGIEMAIGRVILWYLKNGSPVYYCCRDIETKCFRKGSTQNGLIEHPIWNSDVLYSHPDVVWGEGMFDVLSLMELGYGVCGEITCHAIKRHMPELIVALRWRQKLHPDWKFTICLDDDAAKEDGRRPGNDAAEKLALELFKAGIDCHWVKHDTPAGAPKTDINDLHQQGRDSDIIRLIDGALPVSQLLKYDERLFIRTGLDMLSNNPKKAKDIFSIVQHHCGKELAELYQAQFLHKLKWWEIYDSRVKHIWQNNDGIHVEFAPGEHPVDNDMKTYPANRFIEAMRKYQSIPVKVKLSDLDIEEMTSVYIVSGVKRPYPNVYNIFTPPNILTENLHHMNQYEIPPMWDVLLKNLTSPIESKYLLNHLACYFQTFEKPQTIPVLTGNFGTGKNTFFEVLLVRALGKYRMASNNDLLSGFDDWMQNTPCIIIDELEKLHPTEQPRVDAKLRSLINETQNLRIKHKNNQQCVINAYIAILCNSNPLYSPLKIRNGDRRFSVIGGGENRNLVHVIGWSRKELIRQTDDFIRHLRTRSIDTGWAAVPLNSRLKDDLMDMSLSPEVGAIRNVLDDLCKTDSAEYIPVKDVVEKLPSRFSMGSKQIKRLIQGELGYADDRYWAVKGGLIQFRICEYTVDES